MDLEKARHDIQDTLTAMASLEARMPGVVIEQSHWQENRQAGDKLDALISFVQRQHGFPEIQ